MVIVIMIVIIGTDGADDGRERRNVVAKGLDRFEIGLDPPPQQDWARLSERDKWGQD